MEVAAYWTWLLIRNPPKTGHLIGQWLQLSPGHLIGHLYYVIKVNDVNDLISFNL